VKLIQTKNLNNMNKKTLIILLPVEQYDRIDDAEKVEGKNYANLSDIKERFPGDNVLIYALSNFMYDANDQNINLENYWITYVNII
jgi:hypothetical protein